MLPDTVKFRGREEVGGRVLALPLLTALGRVPVLHMLLKAGHEI